MFGFPQQVTGGDTDIQVGYDTGSDTWTLDILLAETLHGEGQEYTFAADTTLLGPGPHQVIERPAGAAFDFYGVAAGETLWILPEAGHHLPDAQSVLTVAFSGEPISAGTFASYIEDDPRVDNGLPSEFIKLHLVDVRGPGEFSVWQTDPGGNPIVWMATSDGIDSDQDLLFLRPMNHGHFGIAFSAPGKYEVDFQASAFLGPGETNPVSSPVVTYTFFVREPTVIVAGADKGAKPMVRVIDAVTGQLQREFLAYGKRFRGGVRVATGDVNNDGILDIITAPGKGMKAKVKVFDGATGKQMAGFKSGINPWGKFRGGAFVAVGDLDGSPGDEIAIGPGRGKKPVRIFNGQRERIGSFHPYGTDFNGGVRVAIADGQIVTTPGSGPSEVHTFVLADLTTAVDSFTAFAGEGGVFMAAADVDGDGTADFIVGSDLGNAVRVFDGSDTNNILADLPAYLSQTLQGVRVAGLDINHDGRADLIVGPGPGADFPIRVLNSPTPLEGLALEELDAFFAFGSGFQRGVFLAAGA